MTEDQKPVAWMYVTNDEIWLSLDRESPDCLDCDSTETPLYAHPPAESSRVSELVWEPVEQTRSDADPSTEITGWEAETPFGTFYRIDMYFGSDAYGFSVCYDNDGIGDADSVDAARHVAQTDFTNRINSVIAAMKGDE